MSLEQKVARLNALKDFKEENKSNNISSFSAFDSLFTENKTEEGQSEDNSAVAESDFIKPKDSPKNVEEGKSTQAQNSHSTAKSSAVASLKAPIPQKEKSFGQKVARFVADRFVDVFNVLTRGFKYAYQYRQEMTDLRDNPPADVDAEIKQLEQEIDDEISGKENKKEGRFGSVIGNIFSNLFGLTKTPQNEVNDSKNFIEESKEATDPEPQEFDEETIKSELEEVIEAMEQDISHGESTDLKKIAGKAQPSQDKGISL